jgi:hypothetical protein
MKQHLPAIAALIIVSMFLVVTITLTVQLALGA